MKERTWYFDLLRIFATFMVIVLHVSAQNFSSVPVSSFEWNVFNVFDSVTRWTVPVFVMISGALFLDGEYTIEKIYKKYILRIVTAFIFWSATYAIFKMVRTNCGLKETLWQLVTGPVHMWFLYMIVGVYMLIPILKKIIVQKDITKYFLVLGFAFSCFIPQLISVCGYVFPTLSKLTKSLIASVDFNFAVGFVFYFVLGYYLSKADISKKLQSIIYLGGVCGLIITIGMTDVISLLSGQPKVDFYGNFTINVLLESIAIFVFFKYKLSLQPSKARATLIAKLSKYSFGVYLAHMLVIEVLRDVFKLNTLTFNPILSIPIIAILVFLISFLISGILNHIPILKKYVV